MPLRRVAAIVAASRQRLHRARQFGAQHCKRGGVRGALRTNHEIDRWKVSQHVAPQDLTQPPAQAIAPGGRRLMARNDEPETRVTRTTVTPGQIEMRRAPAAARFPAGGELRAARESDAVRVPLARLPAPVFGWRTDGETLATLLAPAGQCGAAPNGFHPRAKSMFIDTPPIARPIRRTHKFLSVRRGKLPG